MRRKFCKPPSGCTHCFNTNPLVSLIVGVNVVVSIVRIADGCSECLFLGKDVLEEVGFFNQERDWEGLHWIPKFDKDRDDLVALKQRRIEHPTLIKLKKWGWDSGTRQNLIVWQPLALPFPKYQHVAAFVALHIWGKEQLMFVFVWQRSALPQHSVWHLLQH